MSKRPGGEPDDNAGAKRIHFADESIHGPEHLSLVRRLEEMERQMRALRSENAEKDALLEQYKEHQREMPETSPEPPPEPPQSPPEPPQSSPEPPQSPPDPPQRRVANSRVRLPF
ncbi:hypothetical protein HNY73_008106 [Argiope bruennichi]|uniref:Uncharacterized protein n=1 Tax=Argiope bruennichi TaxID=94029 RepID=A0A8T0F833_ARGBR|nr:hypothetical protein HNY73_008106 [Argiope bruennichi]